jgi:hypothetical protein
MKRLHRERVMAPGQTGLAAMSGISESLASCRRCIAAVLLRICSYVRYRMFDFEEITYRCADYPVLPGLDSYTSTRRHVDVANAGLDLVELTATSGPARGEVSFMASSLA